jgi:hypothetical protein
VRRKFGFYAPRNTHHEPSFPLAIPILRLTIARMFSHVVIFWTDPAESSAANEVIAGAEKYLKPIPGVLHFHVGKMAASHRPVVDQTYQVALNLVFADKKTQDDYQVHPLHLDFVEKCVRRFVKKVVVYDFE